MKTRFFAVVLSIVFVLSICCVALAGSYVGNQRSHIFHFESCEWAQKMSPANAVEISSREEAINNYHMRPCKVCRP